jgi:hypothetical protein
MISWIDRKYKNEYKDSAKASGIRYRFYDYGDSLDIGFMITVIVLTQRS